jgi:uncharacterized protein
MFKQMRWALPVLLLLAPYAGSPSLAKPAPPAKPALWKLADKDTTIYLFGTIHVLPKALKWRTPKFDKAAAGSSELVLEVADLDDQAKTAEIFVKAAQSPGLPPITARIPADRKDKLIKLAEKSGIPLAYMDQLETWAVAIALSSAGLKDLGLDPDDGTESQLQKLFKSGKKPISGLETTEEQLGFFDKLPEAAQRTFLISLIDDSSDMKTEFAAMIGAWTKGDEKAIALSFDDELKLSPELMDTLLRKRNERWTAWIEKRMEKPGTIMIAVGAGHLAGADSVQTMLARKGFKAKRIQ